MTRTAFFRASVSRASWAFALALAAMPAQAHETQSDPRYGCRKQLSPPPGAMVTTLEERVAPLTFAPVVDGMVARFDLPTFDRYLRDVSGKNSVVIGGSSYTFTTRYSYSTGGAKSWQYAYERFQALGYQVRYQDYTHGSHALKNIIATKTGTVTPSRVYVLCGHLDSTSENANNQAPGAEDNGSGSAAVLAAAEVLKDEHFESTIEFVLFSGEEQGLYGSQAYVNEAVAQGRDIRDAVNMDMISYTVDQYGVSIEGGHAWATLMQAMADAVTYYTPLSYIYSYFSWGSDHVPFQDAGIPAILAIDLDWDQYPYYHSSGDTYARTNPGFAILIGKATLATVAQMAGPIAPTTAVADGGARFRLFPNPTASRLSFAGSALDPSAVVRIIDATGRELNQVSAHRTWDLRDAAGFAVPAGVYWARLEGESRRVIVVR
ncbi:MAG: M20/M25/M40 family metallo-hydrolase [Candidatus Eisenbacteria bacterium]